MRKKRCLIFNLAARNARSNRLREYWERLDDCILKPTTGPGAARTLAAEAVREGFETIIAAGGDGTLNEVLNGIGDSPDGFAQTRLAVIPLGTVNVFAQEIRVPAAPEAAWQVIEAGNETLIDLPSVTAQTEHAEVHRYFLQMAGAGLDARAVELVDLGLKRRIGALAYIWAGFKALTLAQAPIEVRSEGTSASGELVVVSNGRYYGGKFSFCPAAEYADGLMDVCVFPKVSWRLLPGYLFAILTNRLEKRKLTVNFQSATIGLSSNSRVPMQLDGEFAGHLPAQIRVHPRKLRIVIP